MKGNEMLDCPACAGPQALGGNCATCHGTTYIEQDTFDAFMTAKSENEALSSFQAKVIKIVNSATTLADVKQVLSEEISAII